MAVLPLLLATAATGLPDASASSAQRQRVFARKIKRWEANVKTRQSIVRRLTSNETALNTDPWEPEWDCEVEDRVGGRTGDGPKWMCGAEFLPSHPVVYSIGSNGDTQFEGAMHRLRPSLDVHTFDPTVGELHGSRILRKTEDRLRSLNGGKFHPWGLGDGRKISLRTGFTFSTRTLGSIMKELGHTHIDVFKMDIEGAEYDSLASVWELCQSQDLYIGHLLIEVHVNVPPSSVNPAIQPLNKELRELFEGADMCGLRLFHKERNGWGCFGVRCVEFSFVHVKHAYITLAGLLGPERKDEEVGNTEKQCSSAGLWTASCPVSPMPYSVMRGTSPGVQCTLADLRPRCGPEWSVARLSGRVPPYNFVLPKYWWTGSKETRRYEKQFNKVFNKPVGSRDSLTLRDLVAEQMPGQLHAVAAQSSVTPNCAHSPERTYVSGEGKSYGRSGNIIVAWTSLVFWVARKPDKLTAVLPARMPGGFDWRSATAGWACIVDVSEVPKDAKVERWDNRWNYFLPLRDSFRGLIIASLLSRPSSSIRDAVAYLDKQLEERHRKIVGPGGPPYGGVYVAIHLRGLEAADEKHKHIKTATKQYGPTLTALGTSMWDQLRMSDKHLDLVLGVGSEALRVPVYLLSDGQLPADEKRIERRYGNSLVFVRGNSLNVDMVMALRSSVFVYNLASSFSTNIVMARSALSNTTTTTYVASSRLTRPDFD